MVLDPSTRIGRISSTCATTRMILEYLPSGTFQLPLMGKELVMVLGEQLNDLLPELVCKGRIMIKIMTPRQLFDWASISIPAVYFEYCSNEDYKREQQNLERRFQNARTFPGTRKLHSYVPISVDKVQVRPFSTCITFKEERVTSGETDIAVESISGFVTCLSDGQWWLACVVQVHVENSRVKLTYLHPHGPSNSFKYPAVQDIHTVPCS